MRHGAVYESAFIEAAGLHLRYNIGLYLVKQFGVRDRIQNAERLIRMWTQTKHTDQQVYMCMYLLYSGVFVLTSHQFDDRIVKSKSNIII